MIELSNLFVRKDIDRKQLNSHYCPIKYYEKTLHMEVLKKSSFWILSCAIAYSIGILIFWTLDSLLKGSAESISAFGSVLSAIGTFFAAFIALHVFNGWKVTEDHKTKNGHINNAVNTYLKLQDFMRIKTIPLFNMQFLLKSQTLTFLDKVQLILVLNEIQVEVLYASRTLQTHIQLFATISNNLTLCGDFEQIINDIETQAIDKLNTVLADIQNSPQSQILTSFDDYFKYITGQLITDLHLKIIIEITKESKALN